MCRHGGGLRMSTYVQACPGNELIVTSMLLLHFLCHFLSFTHSPALPPPSLHRCYLKAHLSVCFNWGLPYLWLNGRFINRKSHTLICPACNTQQERKCVCVREKEWGVGVALGVLMTQFPLRGGPPICEWNRQDLA